MKLASIINKLRSLTFNIFTPKRIQQKGNILIIGKPIVDIRKSCFLTIGTNVTLNSTNKGYHINMHSPVKLFADRENAKIEIGENTRIHGSCIHAYTKISIGKNCLIAANCQIIDGNGHDLCLDNPQNRINTKGSSKPIKINDNVWIGANCIVLPGVEIGEGSVISAGSIVNKNIPPRSLAGGNPIEVLKTQNPE